MLVYYLGDENKRHYVFIKDFNMFMYDGFVVYKLSVQNKFWIVILKTALKLMPNKKSKCLKKVNMLNSKIIREK